MNVFDSGGHFMRLTRPTKPMPYTNETLTINEPVLLTKSNASEIASFWNNHYCGSDWKMDATTEWINSLFDTSKIVLGVYGKSGKLIGTIMSRKIGGSLIGSNLGMTLTADRIFVIEGLCIDELFRGKHLAGWLISYMDFISSMYGPVSHIFSRELNSVPFLSNAVEVETYGYVETSKIKESQTKKITEMPSYMFPERWNEIIDSFGIKSNTSLVYNNSVIDKNDIFCFVCYGMKYGLVLIVDTHRKTKKDLKVYEVVFCMGEQSELLLNSVGYELEKSMKGGVLFGTDSIYHGALNASFSDPWKFGTSGYHATYFYNYLPTTKKLQFLLTRNSI
jgi:hypothetical protein